MGKKREIAATSSEGEQSLTTPIADVTAVPWNPQVSQAMTMEGLSPGERRRAVLVALGLRTPRQKYKSKKQKKSAAKERREQRKKDRLAVFEQYGITPRKRGTRLTPEQKKEKRSERGKQRRALLREMARANPELAKKYGVDPTRFKL